MTEELFNFTRNYPFEEETQYNVSVQTAENWAEQRRLKSAQPRKIFTCTFYPLTKTEVDLIKAFYVARRGSYEQFKFDNPLDLLRYNVRFVDNSIKVSRRAFNTYEVTLMLQTLSLQAVISMYAYELISAVCNVSMHDEMVELGIISDLASILEDIILGFEIVNISVYDSISIVEGQAEGAVV